MELGHKMPPECLFDHRWSRCDLDFWPQDLKMSVHLCSQLHVTCKLGEIPASGLWDIVFTNF